MKVVMVLAVLESRYEIRITGFGQCTYLTFRSRMLLLLSSANDLVMSGSKHQ